MKQSKSISMSFKWNMDIQVDDRHDRIQAPYIIYGSGASIKYVYEK